MEAHVRKDGFDFERNRADVLPGNAGPRIEINAEFVRMIKIARPDRVGMEFDTAGVYYPGEAGSIDRQRLLPPYGPEGNDIHHGTEPGRALLRCTLLVERFAFGAVDETFKHDGAIGDGTGQSAGGYRQVVTHQFELRDLHLSGEIEFIRVGNADLAPIDHQDFESVWCLHKNRLPHRGTADHNSERRAEEVERESEVRLASVELLLSSVPPG